MKEPDKKNVPLFILEFRKSIVQSLLGSNDYEIETVIEKNPIQVYFSLEKYIFLKSPSLYVNYVSRLNSTSRFYGVMSIGWLALAVTSISFFFTAIISSALAILIIISFCFLAFRFIRSSIHDQHELVWNIWLFRRKYA